MQKKRIVLIDFDKLEGNAIHDFLLALGDFEVKSLSSDEYSIEMNDFVPDLVIVCGENPKFISKDLAALFVMNSKSNILDEAISIKSPFRLNSFEAKIRSILRNKENLELRQLEIKGLKYNPANHSLINPNGIEAKLTDKETDILLYLARLRTPATREELLRNVWQYNEGVTTHTLETHIYRLRQKLSQLLDDKDVLLTNDGGYYLDK